MKKYKDISIKAKLPFLIGSVTLMVLALVSIIQVRLLNSTEKENALKLVHMEALGLGNQLEESINGPASIIRAFSGIMQQMVNTTLVEPGKKRELLYREMENLVKSESSLKNIWCIFEPDVLDGLDSMYIDRLGGDASGNFVPWFFKDNKGIRMLTLNETYTYAPYLKVKASLKEAISEPYLYEVDGEMVPFFSICIPLAVNGKFVGAIGTDYNIRDLAKTLDVSSTRHGKLVTDKGTIALYYDERQIGKPAESGNREILDKLSSGLPFDGTYMENNIPIHKTYTPIYLGTGTSPWYYAIEIPETEIYRKAKRIELFLFLGLLAGTIVIIFFVMLILQAILSSLDKITDTISGLSSGNLDITIEEDKNENEIGKMCKQLGRLIDGLQHTASFAIDIGSGNYRTDYQPLSDKDRLGNSLLEMRKNLSAADQEREERRLEEERRNWHTNGIAKFAEILRQDNNDMEALAYNIISNLVKYMGANQGGIFLSSDEEELLEMKACYAYDRKKFTEKKVMFGEGLIGTCYLEGAMIYMTDVPEDYISITSGLGDENPRAILISPLKINEVIYGVIELASFKPFEQYKLDFIEKLSESLAATISSVKVNIRTNKLLEQTKMQAEEMANTEEELRQNMEEMQATQEESQRREMELSTALREMEEMRKATTQKDIEVKLLYDSILDSFNVVEFSPDGLITDINQKVMQLHNAPKEAYIGKTLSSITNDPPEVVNELFANLRMGISQEIVRTVEADGEVVKFICKLLPMVDHDGTLYKVLLYAYKTV